MSPALNPLPVEVISAILARYGDALLMGAHARDHVVGRAGISEGRTTADLDCAIAVSSLDAFRSATRDLDAHGDTGMGFRIQRVHVDLIPFDAAGRLGPRISVVGGVEMDITGIDEAFRTAERLPAPRHGLRVPTLPALIVLKTIAWKMRGGDTDKDAQDLALLLRCVDSGEFADRCYGDELESFDGDPRRVGAFLTGNDAGRDLPRGTAACRDAWRSPALAAAMAPRLASSQTRQDLAQLLSDLALGSEQGDTSAPLQPSPSMRPTEAGYPLAPAETSS